MTTMTDEELRGWITSRRGHAININSGVLNDMAAEVLRLRAKEAAENARLRDLIRWAHDTLWELNPSNYDHDEVCKVNDAAVEVISGLAPVISETHGHSPEWWASRAALTTQEPKP